MFRRSAFTYLLVGIASLYVNGCKHHGANPSATRDCSAKELEPGSAGGAKEPIMPMGLIESGCVESPNGRYAIRYWKPASPQDELGVVVMRDNKNGDECQLLHYMRQVDARWSPKGTFFYVDDYYASNASTCRVYAVADLTRSWDLEALLKEEEKTHSSMSFVNNEKRYVQAVRWVSNSRLKITVWGWGDWNPDGYRAYMDFEIGKGFQHIQVREQGTEE